MIAAEQRGDGAVVAKEDTGSRRRRPYGDRPASRQHEVEAGACPAERVGQWSQVGAVHSARLRPVTRRAVAPTRRPTRAPVLTFRRKQVTPHPGVASASMPGGSMRSAP